MADISNPIFHDEAKAIAHLEASRWPNGPFCPYCGSLNVHRMGGKTQAGMFLCNDCRDKFTARVGSVMERSHIPVHKWLLAMHLMAASKKGMSAKQIERMLGVSYKSAWFLCHRIREAMMDPKAGPIGGEGKIVESDETFVGGRKKNVHKGKPEPEKQAVHALVERGGKMRAKHVADVTAKTLRKNLRKLADPPAQNCTPTKPLLTTGWAARSLRSTAPSTTLRTSTSRTASAFRVPRASLPCSSAA
jgi:transposase-like protein